MSLSDPLIIAAFALAALLLMVLALILTTLRRAYSVSQFRRTTNEQLEALSRGVQHHIEVNAVLALTESFTEDQELLKRLSEYSQAVCGAALLHRVNSLGSDLKKVEETLSTFRNRQANSAAPNWKNDVERCEQLANQLREELEEANNAVQEFDRRLQHAS